MNKLFPIGILVLMLIATFSVTSTTTKISVEKTQQNKVQNKLNEVFTSFVKNALENQIENSDPLGILNKTYMVTMRDGVHLATDVYLPIRFGVQKGTIFLQTPYGKDDLSKIGIFLAVIGWPTVIQDIRGTHDSEGAFQGFRESQTDGPDTLTWIASQSWSNGKVATIGPSALGIAQYFTAGANPPELACQGVMVASPNLHKHVIFPGGEFRKYFVEDWLDGVDSLYLIDEIIDNENSSSHSWDNITLEGKWENVNVPAIHMGGWYDLFLQGTIDAYNGYQHLGGPGARGKSKLVIGPWWHEGYITYTQGELTYPENSRKMVDLIMMYLEMASKYTLGKNNDFDSRPNVSYYVMGDVSVIDAPGNEWRTAEDWPIQADYVSWYFNENGILDKNIPGENEPLTYIYDPANPVPTLGGQNLGIPAGPYDQKPIEGRNDVLVFTSEPLTEPYEATGPIKARLFVSSDCPDTDFTVKLTDVYPDGRSMIICDGILRMRNRNGTDHWEFMQPGQIYNVEVDLWSTSYIWNTGHKIRVDVSSSNYPRFLNNPNTKDSICKNTTYNEANNTIYIDSEHPSCIILPEILQGAPSNPPDKPTKPSGPKNIIPSLFHKYTSSTIDVDDDKIYLLFDWDDGNSSGWLGPYVSGEKVNAIHKWTEKGTYEIRVKAKDINGTQSEWSDSLIINLTKNKQTVYESKLSALLSKFYSFFQKFEIIVNSFR